ncbi:MAG: NAD-dependent epimerase, partial [Pannonibacter phragmitetus]
MHILVIGAAGMVGRKLAQRLTRDGELQGRQITAMTLADVVAADAPDGFDGRVTIEAVDLSEPASAERLI